MVVVVEVVIAVHDYCNFRGSEVRVDLKPCLRFALPNQSHTQLYLKFAKRISRFFCVSLGVLSPVSLAQCSTMQSRLPLLFLLLTGGGAQRFPALWFGTLPSRPSNSSALYDLRNYSLVMLGFTFPDAHNEATLQAGAAAVKKHSGPSPPPVFVYRNAHLALSSFDLQARALATLPPSAWIRNSTAPLPCRPGPGDAQPYNFSDASAADFFLSQLVEEAAQEAGIDGLFLDEVDWAMCGFLQSECGARFSAAEVADLWAGTASTMARARARLASAGKATVQSLFSALSSNSGAIDSKPCLRPEEDWLRAMEVGGSGGGVPPLLFRFYGDLGWYGPNGASASVCAAYLRNMMEESALGLGQVVRAVLPTGATEADVEALAAAALLSLSPRSYIGFSTGWGYDDWRWWGLLGRELGMPAGPAVPLPSGRAWTREFERVTARYDCDTRVGTLEWR